MKISLLAILLSLTSVCRSQDTITVYSKQWAGGFSCVSGNDIIVYFPIPETSVNVDSVHLFIQGMEIDFPGNLLMDYGKGCSFSFGWRTQNCNTMDWESIGYYGIERSQISTSENLENRAIFFYSDGTKSEPFINYREEYLAYP